MNVTSPLLLFVCLCAIAAETNAETPALPDTLMCIPGELVFSEDFAPETVSDRWWFKAEFALRDGALLVVVIGSCLLFARWFERPLPQLRSALKGLYARFAPQPA